MKQLYTLVICLFLYSSVHAIVLFEEGFEGGTFPLGWTQEFGAGTTEWYVGYGDLNGDMGAYEGNYNLVFGNQYEVVGSALYLPPIDFGEYVANPTLSFAFISRGDPLSICCKSNDEDEWTSLSFDYVAYSWTLVTIPLPNPSHSYSIYFNVMTWVTPGVCIDNVVVSGDIPTEIPNPATNLSPANGNIVRSNDVHFRWSSSGASGYLFYLGTDNPPYNLVDGDTLYTTSFSIPNLQPITDYYWKVVPFNQLGNAENCPVVSFTTSLQGSGSISDPFLVATLDDLRFMSEHQSHFRISSFLQISDIDASDSQNWNNGEGWIPICSSTTSRFTGRYNGGGHIIHNLNINRPQQSYIGFIGVNGGRVENLGIENASVVGYDFVGGLCGSNYSSGTVLGCYTSGYVNGRSLVGGLTGFNNCIVSNCLSTCQVSGYEIVGGLIGSVNGAWECVVINCFSTGSVSGVQTSGGLISSYYSGSVNNCFWDIETSGTTYSGAGLGCTTAVMLAATTYLGAGWDFVNETVNGTADVWVIDGVHNAGYPYLTWQRFGPVISVNTSKIDFGTVYLGQGIVESSITLRNISADGLIISEVDLANSTQGFIITCPNIPITLNNGDSIQINITFFSNATGTHRDNLIIISNAVNDDTLSVSLQVELAYDPPANTQNLVMQCQGYDVVLNWSPVTTSIFGTPLTPYGYIVLFSEIPDATADEYYFHGFTTDNTYEHRQVLRYSPRMFYRVMAVINHTRDEFSIEDQELLRKNNTQWGAIKRHFLTDYVNEGI